MGYFEWLISKVCSTDFEYFMYRLLLEYLYNEPFRWTIFMDQNRAADGLELRAIYTDVTGKPCGKGGTCSVLEVLIALAIRCDQDLMYDRDIGSRAGEWFWQMISNMGLYYDDDIHFREEDAREALDRFMDRTYDRDGYGGPFYVENSPTDMRLLELWEQLNLYIEENYWR